MNLSNVAKGPLGRVFMGGYRLSQRSNQHREAFKKALELGLTSYHVCFEPTFDSYNSKLWRNIKVKQLSEYTFKYELAKKNAFTMIKKEKNIFKKYYDFKI